MGRQAGQHARRCRRERVGLNSSRSHETKHPTRKSIRHGPSAHHALPPFSFFFLPPSLLLTLAVQMLARSAAVHQHNFCRLTVSTHTRRTLIRSSRATPLSRRRCSSRCGLQLALLFVQGGAATDCTSAYSSGKEARTSREDNNPRRGATSSHASHARPLLPTAAKRLARMAESIAGCAQHHCSLVVLLAAVQSSHLFL